jgi:hypothetical protein
MDSGEVVVREVVELSSETIAILKEELLKNPVVIAKQILDLLTKEVPGLTSLVSMLPKTDEIEVKVAKWFPQMSLQSCLPFLSKFGVSQKKE